MRKTTNHTLCIMVILAMFFSSFASTLYTYAADDDDYDDTNDYTTTDGKNIDAETKPLYYYEDLIVPTNKYFDHNYHFYSDLYLVGDFYAAYCVEFLGKAHAFKGIVKDGAEYKPSKRFTRQQFKKIVKNLFGYNLKISNPSAKVTSQWMDKQLAKVAKKKYGVEYHIRYKTLLNKGKIDRVDVAIAVYELHAIVTGGDLPAF